jgi:hypothetical protein
VVFDLTRGEFTLVAIISALIYAAGLLPRFVAKLSGAGPSGRAAEANGEAGHDGQG